MFHGSRLARAEAKIVVPSMGDSISEGTLVSLQKSVGGGNFQQESILAAVSRFSMHFHLRSTVSLRFFLYPR